MLAIYLVLFSVLTVSLTLQCVYFGGFNYIFLSALIPNIIITILGLLLSITILDKLLKRKKLLDDRSVIQDILGNQYQDFVSEISNIFLYYVLKEPPSLVGGITIEAFNKATNKVILNLDDYVDKEFILKPIKIMSFNPSDIWNPVYQEIDYYEFCEQYFKNTINDNITDFLGKYITILPSDIRISIFIILDELNSPTFTSPKKFGIKLDRNNTKLDANPSKEVIKNIAIEIEKLQKIMIEDI